MISWSQTIPPRSLDLTFAAAFFPVSNRYNVSEWNTVFNLPTNGTPFTSVTISGETASLFGGSGITMSNSIFAENVDIIGVDDNNRCIIHVGDYAFFSCESLNNVSLPSVETIGTGAFADSVSLTTFDLPNATIIGDKTFSGCTSIQTLYLPVCEELGTTCDNNDVFTGLINKTITLTVPALLMTCNIGSTPDGDILYLINPTQGNSVTIIQT